MDHETAKELFSEYLDGELDAAQKRDLESHLQGCDDCQQELESLRVVMSTLAGLSPAEPPKDFARKVQHTIRRRSKGRFFSAEGLLRRIPFEWISFVIILLMLVMYYMVVQSAQVKPSPDPDEGVTPRAPTSQPASPASQPASRPASQPASQPSAPPARPPAR
jgi:anti-sigma factor RsiW